MAEELKGDKELVARLLRLGVEAPKQLARGVYEVALGIEGKSRDRTPYETGALEGSHETSRPEISSDGDAEVLITVGGPAAPYAIPVHERLDVHHPHGEAKFLERSVLEAVPTFARDVAARLDLGKAMGR